MKLCGKCGISKLENEFNKCKSKYDGLQSTCSSCSTIYRNQHKEDMVQYREEYKKLNSDKIKQANISYYLKNKEKVKARVKQYAKENKKAVLSRNILYLKNNPDKAKHLSRKKYLAFVLKPAVLERDKFSCRLCDSKENLQIHHIIPKKLEASTDTLDNLITLCKSCHKDKAHNGCTRDLNEALSLYFTKLILEHC